MMQRPAKTPEIEQALSCAGKRNAHPVEQVNYLRRHFAHLFDRRLIGKKIPTIDRVVKMLCRRIALAFCIDRTVDAALGADRM